MSPIKTTDLSRLALLAGTALILFVVESAVPRPLPWMKLGLGNGAVLLALLLFGVRQAFAVAAIKILVGGLITGGLAGPAFIISTGAGLASLSIMSLARRCPPQLLSAVGISIIGAVTHQLVQLLLASVYIRHLGVVSLLPLFLLGGLLSGGLIGLVVHWILQGLKRMGAHYVAR
jgi:heptaprenyl diphosphate synthase